MRISPSNCSETIRQYEAQGWHRTASAVDVESAGWLQGRLQSLGLHASLLSFPFTRLDCSPAHVEVAGREFAAVALPDSLLPSPHTVIERPAGGPATPGTIGVLRIDQHRNEPDLDRARSAGHPAVIVAVEGEDATLLNAWQFASPYGPPVLQVPMDAWTLLQQASEAGAPVRVVCGATPVATQALNVVATISGRSSDRTPLAVLTPRSGWWHCAGERGGGIALLLEIARNVAANPLSRDLLLFATTAHELGYLGIRRALELDAGLSTRPAAWLHLGANLGATGARLIVRSSDSTLLDLGRRAAAAAPGLECRVDAESPPAGEASIIAEFGGRWLSMIGAGYHRFHSIKDRWPESLDEDAIVATGTVALEWLRLADAEAGT